MMSKIKNIYLFLLFGGITSVYSQKSYFKYYPEFVGNEFTHLLIEKDLLLLTNERNKTLIPSTQHSLVSINPMDGTILNETHLKKIAVKGNTHYLDKWKNQYIIVSTLINSSYHVTGMQIDILDTVFNITKTNSVVLLNDFFLHGPKFIEGDTLILFQQSHDLDSFDNIVNKILIDLNTQELYLSNYYVWYLAPSSILKIQNDTGHLMYAFDGIYKLNDTLGALIPGVGKVGVVLDTPFFRRGGILHGIDSGYVVFGNAMANVTGEGLPVSIAKLSKDFKILKRSTFFQSPKRLEVVEDQALVTDGVSYFGCVWDITNKGAFPYQDTFPNSFQVYKFDKDINTLWTFKFEQKPHFLLEGIQPDSSGGCYVYGFLRDSTHDYEAIPFLLRIASDGTVTSTNEAPNSKPASLTVYGNPSSTLRFYFDGNDNEKFRLTCANSKGQTLLTQFIQNGMHEFNTSLWSTGMYYLTFYNELGNVILTQPWMKE